MCQIKPDVGRASAHKYFAHSELLAIECECEVVVRSGKFEHIAQQLVHVANVCRVDTNSTNTLHSTKNECASPNSKQQIVASHVYFEKFHLIMRLNDATCSNNKHNI